MKNPVGPREEYGVLRIQLAANYAMESGLRAAYDILKSDITSEELLIAYNNHRGEGQKILERLREIEDLFPEIKDGYPPNYGYGNRT